MMTRQESLQQELRKIINRMWEKDTNFRIQECSLAENLVEEKNLTEVQLDIAELLILRYYECGGE